MVSKKSRQTTRKRPDPWDDWKARGLTLPSDEELHRLSQPDAVAPVGMALVPITTTEETTT